MDKAERWLDKKLQFRFADPGLFARALTHRSAKGRNNERLEYLGDAILDFVISDALFRLRPHADEGDLSRLRSALVKDATLAAIASDLEIGEHIILGDGERKTGGHRRQSILADALEALFGAIYLDAGFDATKSVIERIYSERLASLPEASELRDSKTRLQEWLQARKFALPVYELIEESGQDHKKRFLVTCTVTEFSETTRGEAASRRSAEQLAARRMLGLLARDGS